jgi:hypothetical protein
MPSLGRQKRCIITNQYEYQAAQDDTTGTPEQSARRLAIRENAKRVIRESGLGEMLQALNRNLLKGRGWVEEYDSMLLFKWGTGYTLRHIWITIEDDLIRFRLLPHRTCGQQAPLCDGEYHTLTKAMWSNRSFLQAELKRYYDRPVAEASSD